MGKSEYKFIPHMGVIFQAMGKRLPVAPSFTEVVFRVKTFPMVTHHPIDSIRFCTVNVVDVETRCKHGKQPPCRMRIKYREAIFPNSSMYFPSFFDPELHEGDTELHRTFKTYDTGRACRALQSDLKHAIDLYNARLVEMDNTTASVVTLLQTFESRLPCGVNETERGCHRGSTKPRNRSKRYISDFLGSNFFGPLFGLEPRADANLMREMLESVRK